MLCKMYDRADHSAEPYSIFYNVKYFWQKPSQQRCSLYSSPTGMMGSQSWVKHPEFLDLMYTDRIFLISVDPTGTAHSQSFSFWCVSDLAPQICRAAIAPLLAFTAPLWASTAPIVSFKSSRVSLHSSELVTFMRIRILLPTLVQIHIRLFTLISLM